MIYLTRQLKSEKEIGDMIEWRLTVVLNQSDDIKPYIVTHISYKDAVKSAEAISSLIKVNRVLVTQVDERLEGIWEKGKKIV